MLTPDNCVFALVDYQSSTAVDVESMDRALLVNNTAGLARTAQAVGAPIVLTTILAERGGPIFPEVMSAYPGVEPVDHTNQRLGGRGVRRCGGGHRPPQARARRPVDGSLRRVHRALGNGAGYDVYVCADACAGVSPAAYEMALRRLVAAGAIPVTWLGVLSELMRDWKNLPRFEGVLPVAMQHAGGVSLRMQYGEASMVAGAAVGGA